MKYVLFVLMALVMSACDKSADFSAPLAQLPAMEGSNHSATTAAQRILVTHAANEDREWLPFGDYSKSLDGDCSSGFVRISDSGIFEIIAENESGPSVDKARTIGAGHKFDSLTRHIVTEGKFSGKFAYAGIVNNNDYNLLITLHRIEGYQDGINFPRGSIYINFYEDASPEIKRGSIKWNESVPTYFGYGIACKVY